MNEIIQLAISPTILPLTVLLGVCLFYWAMVFLGFIEAEMIDFAHQFDLDLHLDGDAHSDHGHGDHGHGNDGHHADHGFLGSLYTFFIGTDAPMMIPVTILSLSTWTGMVLCAHYMDTGTAWGKATLLFLPVALLSLFITKFASIPFNSMFKVLNTDYDAPERVLGKMGTVASLTVSDKHGQVEVEAKGAPLLLNAIKQGGPNLKRGDEVYIAELLEQGVYVVKTIDFENDLHPTNQKEEEPS